MKVVVLFHNLHYFIQFFLGVEIDDDLPVLGPFDREANLLVAGSSIISAISGCTETLDPPCCWYRGGCVFRKPGGRKNSSRRPCGLGWRTPTSQMGRGPRGPLSEEQIVAAARFLWTGRTFFSGSVCAAMKEVKSRFPSLPLLLGSGRG